MFSTKRMPRPMTGRELSQYRELRACLVAQAELIMRVFTPVNAGNEVMKVVFEVGHHDGAMIDIWHCRSYYGEDRYECFSCPESYLGMTEDELMAEKKRLKEEEERKKAEMVEMARASREKRIAEKEAKEKDKRYRKYLELKKEFEGKEKVV